MARRTEIRRFLVKTDNDEMITIIEYQEWLSAKGFDEPHAEVPGIKGFETFNGLSVTHIDDTTFKINITEQIARKV